LHDSAHGRITELASRWVTFRCSRIKLWP
jgi:hypothetical protein